MSTTTQTGGKEMTTATKLTTRSGWWEFSKAIAAGEDFDTSGALKGRNGYAQSIGQLPKSESATLGEADYVIYSYSTPIAWRTQGQWHTPNVKYSVTTSRHQSKIFTAIDQLLQFA
jgi:hypothetical protein